jgi:hypothetical protein
MCRAGSSSTGSSSSSSSSPSSSSSSSSFCPSSWYAYFREECLQRGAELDELVGGELGDWLGQNEGSLPPVRLRERAWMQLLADDTEPESPSVHTVSAERLDKPEPVRRQIR